MDNFENKVFTRLVDNPFMMGMVCVLAGLAMILVGLFAVLTAPVGLTMRRIKRGY